MKLKHLLIILALLMSAIIGAFSGLAASSLGGLGSSLKDNADKAAKYANLLNETRTAQVAFQRQVQEWKNILIRGNDKELFDKHFKSFQSEEKAMDASLTTMQVEMKDIDLDSISVDKIMKDHEAMGKKYRDALSTFDAADKASGQAVDVLVRGMDRPTSAGLTELGNGIEKRATDTLTKAADRAKKDSEQALATFLTIAGVSGALTLMICYGIGRSVLRKVGAEPSELSESFAHIAKGDLTQPLPVKDGDDSSLAASAALMQMRMKSMVKSIHNGAAELGDATDKAGLSSSMEEVKSALRSARTAVKGLSDAADRFKV